MTLIELKIFDGAKKNIMSGQDTGVDVEVVKQGYFKAFSLDREKADQINLEFLI